MTHKILYLILWVCFLKIVKSETPENNPSNRRTRVQVKIPNFLNDLVPNLEKIASNFNGDPVPFLQHRQGENAVPPHIHRIRENYQALREFIRSALRLGTRQMNTNGLFALDLRNDEQNTKLNMDTVLGRLSLNAKATTDKPALVSDSTEGSSTEVPLNEYLTDLLEEQTRRLGDFSMNLQDARGNPFLSVKSSNKKTKVNLSSPVQVSVESKAGESIKRSGFLPPEVETEDDLDPEVEYLKHAEDLHRRNLKLRGYDVHFADTVDAPEFSQARSAGQITQSLNPTFNSFSRRKILPFGRRKDPIKKMTEYYYNLSTGQSKQDADEDEAFDEYIEDLQKVTGTLREDSKIQLKVAFKQFRTSLEKIDFGDKVDISKLIDEPEDFHSWIPERTIDQKGIEMALLNIDENEKPNPFDNMVLAFTLTGVPLKIYMDPNVKDQLKFLHEHLSKAGVTLNIPVKSFKEMEPVGGEILYIGADNKGELFTRSTSIIVPSVERISSYINRFSKANFPVTNENDQASTSRQESTSSKNSKFSDILVESYKRDPDQVMDDILKFLEKSPIATTNEPADDVTVETEI